MIGWKDSCNFNPLPPHGGRRITDILVTSRIWISIHSLRMEGDVQKIRTWNCYSISIHSLRMEGDQHKKLQKSGKSSFQSTPSAWRETEQRTEWMRLIRRFQSTPSAWRETSLSISSVSAVSTFQSTPSAWRETAAAIDILRGDTISIHSLRMEGDTVRKIRNRNPCISIHSLRMEGDVFRLADLNMEIISIHSLRMEGDVLAQLGDLLGVYISIHSLRMEGDAKDTVKVTADADFNPLPPHGGRPVQKECTPPPICISIHSLRMEGDWGTGIRRREFTNFNPLPPHGGRPTCTETLGRNIRISIHSLRMEGDAFYPACHDLATLFQSTPSAWRETTGYVAVATLTVFQSTPSAWRETDRHRRQGQLRWHFNPLPPHGGRLNSAVFY